MLKDDKPVFVSRNYHGTEVKLHKDCAKRWDEQKEPTAQEVPHYFSDGYFEPQYLDEPNPEKPLEL